MVAVHRARRARRLALSAIGGFLLAATAVATAGAVAERTSEGTTALLPAGEFVTISTVFHNANHQTVTSVPVGTPVHPKALLVGAYGTPTGTVDATYYAGPACTGSSLLTVSNFPIENGAFDPASAGAAYTRNIVGSISVRVHYDGNATYGPRNGNCESLIIVKANPTVTVAVHAANHQVVTSTPYGTPIHPRIEITGPVNAGSGSVEFRFFAIANCSGAAGISTVNFLNGVSDTTANNISATPGTHSMRVTFNGNALYNAGSSACRSYTVNRSLVSFFTHLHDPSHLERAKGPLGMQIHAAWELYSTPGLPVDGDVLVSQFSDANCQTPSSGSVLDPVQNKDPAGGSRTATTPITMSWQLKYLGGANYESEDGPCLKFTWLAIPTVVTALHDGNHSAGLTFPAGTSIHVRTAVTGDFGTPTGKVSAFWWENTTCSQVIDVVLGDAQLSGGVAHDVADAVTPSAAGTYSLLTYYSGDGAYLAANSDCKIVTITTPQASAPPTTAPTVKPTANPTPKPTAKPAATPIAAPTAAATAAATTMPTPASSALPSDPAPSAAPTAAPTVAPSAGSTAGSSGVPGTAGPTAGAGGPTPAPSNPPVTSPSGDSGGGFGLVVLILLLVLIALGFGFWFGRRGQAKRPA